MSYSILGTKDEVKLLHKHKIVNFIQKNYLGDRIVVAAAGNIEHDRVVNLVERHLNTLSKESRANAYPLSKPPISQTRDHHNPPEVEYFNKTVSDAVGTFVLAPVI